VGSIYVFGRTISPLDAIQRIVSPPTTSLLFVENSDSSADAVFGIASIFNGLEDLRLSQGRGVLGIVFHMIRGSNCIVCWLKEFLCIGSRRRLSLFQGSGGVV
jgi:hypothetical protein